MFSSEFLDISGLPAFEKLKAMLDNLQISQENEAAPHVEPVPTITYLCKYCNKKFLKFDEAKILKHVNSKHVNPDSEQTGSCSDKVEGHDYPCNLCGKKFSREFDLKQHEDAKHKKNMKARNFSPGSEQTGSCSDKTEGHGYPCNLCGKKFLREFDLQQHKDAKHKEKTKVCNLCGKKFQKRLDLKQHRNHKHFPHKQKEKGDRENESTGKVKCKLCGKQFLKSRDMRQHRNHKHFPRKQKEKNNKENGSTGNIQCKLCHKSFSREVDLKHHEGDKHILKTESTETEKTSYSLDILFG